MNTMSLKGLFSLFLIIGVALTTHAQSIESPKQTSSNYMYCYNPDGDQKFIKVYKLDKKRSILKIQEQLSILDYPVVKTGVFDAQTKMALKAFNKKANLHEYPGVVEGTKVALKKAVKAHRK